MCISSFDVYVHVYVYVSGLLCSPSQLLAPPNLYRLGRYLKLKQRTLDLRHPSESIQRLKLKPDAKKMAYLVSRSHPYSYL
jgi:hypothetical protein